MKVMAACSPGLLLSLRSHCALGRDQRPHVGHTSSTSHRFSSSVIGRGGFTPSSIKTVNRSTHGSPKSTWSVGQTIANGPCFAFAMLHFYHEGANE